ncbi:hypothetical protein [Nonomuraea sp. 10N515B]|uniref:hypothetical protein n=1 Tax=Nonomuraea sp. 10N515B TaxID=3457422 RepID=UPI003FCEB4E6
MTVDTVLYEGRDAPSWVHAFLDDFFPPWMMTIVDTAQVRPIAMAGKVSRIHLHRMNIRGGGAALKAAWRDSLADIPPSWMSISPLNSAPTNWIEDLGP